MRFKKVSDDKLQIILSFEDLKKRNIAKWDLLPHNTNAQKVFQEILEEAYDACGFEVENNTQLMIEAFPISAESMLINVTKVGVGHTLLEEEILGISNRLLEELKHTEEADDELDEDLSTGDEMYCFQLFDDVIALSMLLEESYSGKSTLYKYEERYFLHLPDLQDGDEMVYGVLAEYANRMDLVAEFLQEHGEILIEDDALNRLRLVG